MSDLQSPIVGPRTVTDGQPANLRADRQGNLVVQHGHGEMYEETNRGNVWTISTAAAGIGIVTSVGIIATAANNPIIGLFNPTNPLGGGVNCHITRTVLVATTGTAVTGGFVWGILTSPTNITAAGATARNNKTFIAGGHQARPFDGSAALTGGSAPTLFRQFGSGFPGALAAGTNTTIEETEDDLVVAPGAYIGLYAALGATGLNVVASLTWAEIAT